MPTSTISTEDRITQIKDNLAPIEWILDVRPYPHDEYDAMVDTTTRFVEADDELAVIENSGMEIRAFSNHAPSGFRLYCDLR